MNPWDASQVEHPDEDVVILQNWDELRTSMWNYVGIVRTTKRLQRALHRIEMLKREITEYYQDYRVSKNLIELRNLVLVSEMIEILPSISLASKIIHKFEQP